MDCIVQAVTKSQTGLSDFHFHQVPLLYPEERNIVVSKGLAQFPQVYALTSYPLVYYISTWLPILQEN